MGDSKGLSVKRIGVDLDDICQELSIPEVGCY